MLSLIAGCSTQNEGIVWDRELCVLSLQSNPEAVMGNPTTH